MKIESVAAIVLRLPEVTAACDGTQDTCLIQIQTDAGITGWGEVDSAPTVVKAVVDAPLSHQISNGLANALVGADPLAIDVCQRRMQEAANYYGRAGVGTHAMAGIDIALWDIKGKALDRPIYQLLGGPHQKSFRAYCSILFGDTPAETYERARRFADEGFTAIKFGWGPMGQSAALDIELVRQARLGAGEDVDVLIDAGQVWNWKTALQRAEQFAEFQPFWLEEPLQPDDLLGYSRLSEASPIPIAAGEAESRVEDFRRLIAEGGIDWVQPDPGRCGLSGMVEVGKISLQHGRKCVNHSFKSGITIAASLHGLTTMPTAEMFEFCMADSPLRHKLTHESFPLQDGRVHAPEGPGLGVTINDEVVAKYRVA